MILAIDSASLSASAALVSKEGRLIAQAFQNTGLTHSSTLLPMIEAMLKNARKEPDELQSVVVSNGPGSFTGLRIGVSAALGLSEALGIPACGVSSLRAAAYGALPFDGMVFAVMDARREQYYAAAFESDGQALRRLREDQAVGKDQLFAEMRNSNVCWVGDAAFGCRSLFGGTTPPNPFPSAYGAALCMLHGETRNAEEIVYLRLPQAERERLEKLSEQDNLTKSQLKNI